LAMIGSGTRAEIMRLNAVCRRSWKQPTKRVAVPEFPSYSHRTAIQNAVDALW